MSIFNNGTIALITALQALDLNKGGEVITTPFTFVATAHSIIWNNLKPVFVDINPKTTNIDPVKVEEAITEKTVAILPVHCYGVPCDVDRLNDIAMRYDLKLIYDAAHAFGINYKGTSLLNYGDLSVLSFHATKVFNTFEGGAIISHDLDMKKKIDQLRNFGIDQDNNSNYISMNGKMSEIHAAAGLLQLQTVKKNLEQRKKIDSIYRELLTGVQGIEMLERGDVEVDNYAYFPILVNSGYIMSRDELFDNLKINNIIARKYFYPILTEMNIYKDYYSFTPNALKISNNVICLPIYVGLDYDKVEKICSIIKGELCHF